MKISAVVLTKNEQMNIERCLKSISFCDEIIVIDDNSDDKTVELAKKYKAVVHKRELEGDFASQRNFGMKKAAGEWILFVDGDEEVMEELKREINDKLQISNYSAYLLKRRDFWWGRELKYGETRKVSQEGLIRLLRKDSGKWVGKIHETFITNGPIVKLNFYLNHYPHPTLTEFIKEVNFYSTLRAKELFSQNKSPSILEIIFFPLGKFLLNYFIYLGFLDGPAGFAYAFMMSFHSFLVRSKLYQYKKIDMNS